MASHEQHEDHGDHIVPVSTYLAVFGSLIVLTVVTAWVATLDLGRANFAVAISIAIVKASLVALFFMHVKYSDRLTKIIVVSGVFWLLLLLGITVSDFFTRGWMGVPGR